MIRSCSRVVVENTHAGADAEAMRRFREKAEEYLQALNDSYNEPLPGNHSAAEAVLLAHLMTASTGYHEVNLIADWDKRPMSGWQTSLVFFPNLWDNGNANFGLECRNEQNARQLAILIDDQRAGERLPHKLQNYEKLIAHGFRVLEFSESDILNDANTMRERIETVLFDMAEAVLTDSGKK